jgi:hypothetical protein
MYGWLLQVRAILGDKVPNLDAIIEAIPDLMRPQQTLLTLSNLRRWVGGRTWLPSNLLQADACLSKLTQYNSLLVFRYMFQTLAAFPGAHH